MGRIAFFLTVFFILSALSLASADVVSINSGGSKEIVINPDTHIEGFFSCVPSTCSTYGYTCGDWEDSCGNTINCGTCASGETCTSGTCVAVPTPPSGPGGGGPGGGAAPSYLKIFPLEFNLRMEINTNQPETIDITNDGTTSMTVSIRQQNLDNMVILGNTSMTIRAGETKHLNVIFVAPSTPGIYTGKIIIGGKEILVTLNVKTLLLLFDSNVVVLNRNYQVSQGDNLRTKVTLIPLGDEERMDVTLKFSIKDYNGKTYLTKTETMLIQKKVDVYRNFDTGILPLGDYVIGLELIYSGGVAPSSAHFEVTKQKPFNVFLSILIFLLVLVIAIIVIIIIILIKRRREEERI